MANNKKKLRKKLRNELMQKSAPVISETTKSEIVEKSTTDAIVDYSHIEPKQNSKSTTSILAHNSINIVKKDVLLILIIFVLLFGAMITSKYYDNSHHWVLTFANFLFSRF